MDFRKRTVPPPAHQSSLITNTQRPPKSEAPMTGRAHIETWVRPGEPSDPVQLWTSINNWKEPYEMREVGTDEERRRLFVLDLKPIREEPFQWKVKMGDEWILDHDGEWAQDPNTGAINNLAFAKHLFDDEQPAEGEQSQGEQSQAGQPGPSNPPPSPPGNSHASAVNRPDETEQAPLLRHESFGAQHRSHYNAPRRGSMMSTILEESSNSLNHQALTAPEQARSYQRVVVEAMPDSIDDGFQRVSVLLPPGVLKGAIGGSQSVHEFDRAPLLRHETIFAKLHPQELDRTPLLRHETAEGAHIPSSDSDVTLVNDGQRQELFQAPLFGHEAVFSPDSSPGSSCSSEAMMFKMDPFDSVNPRRVSSFYGEQFELDRSPTFTHETEVDIDENSELYRAPTMSYENGFSSDDDVGTEITDPDSSSGDNMDDLVQQIKQGVQTAIIGSHRQDRYYRDDSWTRHDIGVHDGSLSPGLPPRSAPIPIPNATPRLTSEVSMKWSEIHNYAEKLKKGEDILIAQAVPRPRRPGAEDEDESKRYSVLLNSVPVIVGSPSNTPQISFIHPGKCNKHGNTNGRIPTPYPHGATEDHATCRICRKILEHLCACFKSRSGR